MDQTGQETAWRGEFDTVGGRIEGRIEVHQGNAARADGDVTGVMDAENQLDFQIVSGPGAGSFFRGRLTDQGLEGEYTSAEGDSGTWVGSWRPATGLPAPTVAPSLPRSAQPSFEDVSPQRDYPCSLLESPRALFTMSGGGVATLRMLCGSDIAAVDGEAKAHGGRVNEVITALFGSSGWVTQRLAGVFGIAVAQSPPTNVLVNCPSAASGCTPGPDGSDVYPRITQNEVSVAASGANEQFIVTAYNDFSHFGLTGFATSIDGGQTWSDRGAPPKPPGGVVAQNGADPVVASDASLGSTAGYFYLARIGTSGTTGSGIQVSRSKTSGVTFEVPVNSNDRGNYFADKPDLKVDSVTGYVYVCWTEYREEGMGDGFRQVRFARSTNAGTSFSFGPSIELTQLDASVSNKAQPIGCSITVSQSNVFVAWLQGASQKIEIVRSTDRGASFQATPCCDPDALKMGFTCGSTPVCTVVGSAVHPPFFPDICGEKAILTAGDGVPMGPHVIRNLPFPYLATDALTPGIIQAVWDFYDNAHVSSEIHFSRCENCGNTAQPMAWTPAVRVNDNVNGDQFQPRIATSFFANPGGTQYAETRVIWYDRKRDTEGFGNTKYDVYQTTSIDRGVTWFGSSRLTDVSEPNPLPRTNPPFDCSTFECYFGDYIGISNFPTIRGKFVAAWGDTRGPQVSGTPCPGGPSSSVDPNVRAAVGC